MQRADHVGERLGRLRAHHRQLRDRVALHQLDRLADLVVGLDRDQLGQPRAPCLACSTSSTVGAGAVALEEAVLEHVVVVEELGQVGAAAVGDQGDDRRVRGRSARPPRAPRAPPCPPEPPTRMPSSRAIRRAVRNESRSDTVTYSSTSVGSNVSRPEVLADALDQVGVHRLRRVDRALGVGADHEQVGLLLLQVAGACPRSCRRCRPRSRARRARRRSAPRSPGPVVS